MHMAEMVNRFEHQKIQKSSVVKEEISMESSNWHLQKHKLHVSTLLSSYHLHKALGTTGGQLQISMAAPDT